ncbi:CoF synthetase [Mesorhizobium sp. M1C.F.Ca.ET.193.01.1.1]|uniref:F390 synthetase-related protein n=1 Tax=unclassified Mesorhizobium TaxID=325217 RepID=UPI000FD4EAFA|nr:MULTISPECIES: F390 synthetase-related protein [unclassified Mesorhizobium]TGS95652.1 CoF synthetase [bacterium M00.F.Ca.ET.177.01.1.1]TGQ51724.1 CoF synthetase [Mesorhizobium sp. M1C.F.Ca.ET.210.01.1.1]TGQ67958.1 CoF synthetase [Mesorhizobium sp. M1C.F.Ca.ET.212.01.1.1]TGR03043.1 CoF synthetase [Mesorhizobium sp. M1C.F.Ca.ET.204.01.1.1]TGR23582.1 CoF synthetase [Mesorhizobium sp. M1C.F.Ca.ET.196.01.1.1]
MNALGEAVGSFVLTRWVSRKSRADFERWQAAALRRFLDRDLPRAPFYRQAPARLTDLPVTDKALLMARFEDFNIHGITAAEAWAALARDGGVGNLTVGASTGTSGNRGLFVISEAEKYRWLGTILAKAAPDLLWRGMRVAVILPQNTGLYDSARKSRLIKLTFFDLTPGPERWREALEAFDPTVIIAPPKVLRHISIEGFRLAPKRIFSAAETLDPIDRRAIESFFKLPLDQIYMATEGLLAVTCRHGGLHLAEDSVVFEFEPAGEGLVTPLITAFRRQTQIMARYRMNDLLRLSEEPCRCGSPLRCVDEIVGRMDDVFRLASPGGPILITPDVLRNAVLKADRRIDDFRLVQVASDTIELRLPRGLADDAATAALQAVRALLEGRNATVTVTLIRAPLPLETSRKLRRVECRVERTP